MKTQASTTQDIEEVWKRTSKRIHNMSEEESLAIFVNAGILTPKGNVRKRFKEVIVPMKPVSR
jgi:hypothetical protein